MTDFHHFFSHFAIGILVIWSTCAFIAFIDRVAFRDENKSATAWAVAVVISLVISLFHIFFQ